VNAAAIVSAAVQQAIQSAASDVTQPHDTVVEQNERSSCNYAETGMVESLPAACDTIETVKRKHEAS